MSHRQRGRPQEPAPKIKRDGPSAGVLQIFVPSFRPSFGNLPGPAMQPWHRVACQGCCQRIIRRKRLAVLIDQSPVAAASQPPYLSCPSSPHPSNPRRDFGRCLSEYSWPATGTTWRHSDASRTWRRNTSTWLPSSFTTSVLRWGGIQGTDLGCCHAQDPRRVATPHRRR